MKKKIMLIGIGIGLIFVSGILLSSIMIDSDLAFQISMGIGIAYFILLTIFVYAKNLYSYFKTGQFPDKSWLAILVIELLTFTSSKNIGSSLFAVSGAYSASKEFHKANNKLGIFTYTLFYIALWSFLGFIFYSFVFSSYGLNSISNTLLLISFIAIMLAVFIIIIFGLLAKAKSKKDREKEYQQLNENNKLAYDLKIFKRHYGRPYYVLAYIGIIGIILFGLSTLYKTIYNDYVPVPMVIRSIIGFILMFDVCYLPMFFPVIIHTMKMNSKRQQITLEPLKIKMITKDGDGWYGTYEKVEKNYFVNEIESYSITNRWFILNGQIESVIRKTEDNLIEEKNETLNKLKIPRVFSNENIFIEYLEKSLKNRKI